MLGERSIIVREKDRRLVVHDTNRTTIIRSQSSVRVVEVGRQGPPGSASTGSWALETFQISSNGQRQFTLAQNPLLSSAIPALNGLAQNGFSLAANVLSLDNDVETVIGDVLSVHYQF